MSTNTIYTQISKATVISKTDKITEEIQNEINTDVDRQKVDDYNLQSITSDETFIYLTYQKITYN